LAEEVDEEPRDRDRATIRVRYLAEARPRQV
jgi:hypothetical protein